MKIDRFKQFHADRSDRSSEPRSWSPTSCCLLTGPVRRKSKEEPSKEKEPGEPNPQQVPAEEAGAGEPIAQQADAPKPEAGTQACVCFNSF